MTAAVVRADARHLPLPDGCVDLVVTSPPYASGKRALRTTDITGYACACPEPTAPTTPALVVDAFGGTGTTALVASVLGRHAISVDLSADYCRLAAWRTTDPGECARAMQVPKPPPPPEGMDTLFDLAAP